MHGLDLDNLVVQDLLDLIGASDDIGACMYEHKHARVRRQRLQCTGL